MGSALRVIFMGTPDFSITALRRLIASRHDVVCVYSQPPRPKGRGQLLTKSPVHGTALEAGIAVRTPLNFKRDEEVAAFMALEADVAVVAAYGLILPRPILDAPAHGCINIHASLLPRWRGAAPIHRAILEGDSETGITIMQMEEGLDTGPMIAKKAVPIRATTSAQSLHDVLSALGGAMIEDVLDNLAENGALPATPQSEDGATYARMLKKDESAVDWADDAAAIERRIRAFDPWPGCWCKDAKGRRLKLIEVQVECCDHNLEPGSVIDANGLIACGHGSALRLLRVQPENKAPMGAGDAARGGYLAAGVRLG